MLRQALDRARRLGADVDPLKFPLADAAERGERGEGLRLLREIENPADRHLTDWVQLAAWYVAFDSKDQAFARLDSAVAGQSYDLLFVNLDPAFSGIRSDSRYAALRRRMRLPP